MAAVAHDESLAEDEILRRALELKKAVPPGEISKKNRDRPRSYLGSTVEYKSDLGLSGHPKQVYYNMV